jgi:hypothetical protein
VIIIGVDYHPSFHQIAFLDQMDVHKETISIAVLNPADKLVMESILETRAATILKFVQGLRGNLHVTLEEATWATW